MSKELLTAEEVIEEIQEEENSPEVEQEIDQVDQEENQEENQEEEEDKEVVERAKKFGHLSKEEWIAQGRDPDQYKTPEEFDKTGKILEQIYALRKKVDQRDREIHSLVEYQKRTSQREFERAKQEIESRLAASKEDLDMEGVAHYTKELTRLQDKEVHEQQSQAYSEQQQAKDRFVERNQHWFNDRNPDLMRRAVEIDNELKSVYPNATYDELAQKIETRMQYDYPDRILGQAVSRPAVSPSRSSVNKTAVNKTSPTRVFNGLSQDLKDTYNATKRIIESRGDQEYSVNDFIEQLKKDGEL